MTSKVDICNLALQNIGANSITTLTDGSVSATQCNLRYEHIRRAILELHLWNFAIKRVSLNKESATPAFGYANQFVLPSDFIRIAATERQMSYLQNSSEGYYIVNSSESFLNADNYKIEISSTGNRVLLSNDGNKNILYVFDQQDISKAAPLFIELFAKGLGAAIAYKITGSRTLADAEKKEFDDMLAKSKTIDAQQGTFEKVESSKYILARR